MSAPASEPTDPAPVFVSEVVADVMDDADAARALTASEVTELLDRFVSFTPDEPVDQGYQRVLVKKDEAWLPRSAKSVKPGNLRFNLGTLFEAVASGASAVLAISKSPLMAVFSGLAAVRKLVRAVTVDITEREALVVWSLWSCEQRGEGAAEEICAAARAEAERVGSGLHLSIGDVRESLRRLERIDCVGALSDGRWETRETVVVST